MSSPGARPLADEPVSWPVASSEQVYDSGWIWSVREDVVTRPGHDEQFTRVIVTDPGAVIVLALDDLDNVVVVRHYRHAAQARLLELPAGVLDEPGEDPEVAARRELREETGLEAREWRHLFTTFPTPGKSEETHAYFLARELREVEHGFVHQHEEAEMTVVRVPLDDLVEAVLDQRAADAPLAVAVLAYESLRRRGRV